GAAYGPQGCSRNARNVYGEQRKNPQPEGCTLKETVYESDSRHGHDSSGWGIAEANAAGAFTGIGRALILTDPLRPRED
ncbi:MAG: hypothetical protein ACK55S_11110, partial [Planctomycetota bacterium]